MCTEKYKGRIERPFFCLKISTAIVALSCICHTTFILSSSITVNFPFDSNLIQLFTGVNHVI